MAQKRAKDLKRRHRRIRRRLSGTPEIPRLAVRRTSKHIYVQLVDDVAGRSLGFTSTLDPSIREGLSGKSKTERSKIVGQKIAEIAKGVGIERVAFDRGGHIYHGRVLALAESAREAGLKF
ncbi:MAG: 50S ribosomal protein L18 [Candidatus Eisenbacteria bacterium]|uniref:Large ribosomal subunit protein uL18 n=1 Tax=Eiseniibacteriota bacterium TaxID=2212470 RepID=A0A956LZI5_UNCEI|nr:50S ribosomal protein L18 [Candidatus Eisenbacteria bacterium]